MKKKIALIFGITGQDGAYLAEFLLKKNYIVHGVKRRSSLINTTRIDHLYKDIHEKKVNFFLHYGDISDSLSIQRIINQIHPDEIYNLAAQSHFAVSFEIPEYTANVDALGTLRILESIRQLNYKKKIKFINHHYCHLASTHFLSGFDNSCCVSIDGLGEIESIAIGKGEGKKIKLTESVDFPNSLGMFYSAITHYLGFQALSSEGTVMALATFGNYNQLIPQKKNHIL